MKNSSHFIFIIFLLCLLSYCTKDNRSGTSIETSTVAEEVKKDLTLVSNNITQLKNQIQFKNQLQFKTLPQQKPSSQRVVSPQASLLPQISIDYSNCAQSVSKTETSSSNSNTIERYVFASDTAFQKIITECESASFFRFYSKRIIEYNQGHVQTNSEFIGHWSNRLLLRNIGKIQVINTQNKFSFSLPHFGETFSISPDNNTLSTYIIFHFSEGKYFGGFTLDLTETQRNDQNFNPWMEAPIFNDDSITIRGYFKMKYRGDSLLLLDENRKGFNSSI